MSKSDYIIIERNKKFSESCLFPLQREYFDKKGINAWVDDVPFYATSNPFLANCYAEMTVRFIQDWAKKYPESKKHPFYIVELGAGSGILSFNILKKITELKKRFRMEDIQISYVMTDYTESNLTYWSTHPGLQEFIESKLLDFSTFNMEKDTTVNLRNAGIVLTPGSLVNPLTIYANYMFDTVSQDAFTVKNGQLYASLVTLSTHKNNLVDGKPKSMEDISIEYHIAAFKENYYPDPDFNTVLNSYRKSGLKNSYFLFPTAGLVTLANLKKLSNNKVFLLSTDKAYSYLQELEGLGTPDIAHHGSFSTMVNFHAIAKYFEVCGGKSVLQTQRAEVNTAAFYLGFNMEDFPEFAFSVYQHVERLSPGDYFALHRNIRDNFKHCNINTLAAHMALADWDPHIFGKISKYICSQITEAERETKTYFTSHMADLAGHYYYMPKIYDVFFDIGILFHTLQQYGNAVSYYKKSIEFYGEQFNTLHNLAICEYNAGQAEEALQNFKRAYELNPDSKETKEWMDFIEKEHPKS